MGWKEGSRGMIVGRDGEQGKLRNGCREEIGRQRVAEERKERRKEASSYGKRAGGKGMKEGRDGRDG